MVDGYAFLDASEEDDEVLLEPQQTVAPDPLPDSVDPAVVKPPLAFPKRRAALTLGAIAAILALIFLIPKAPRSAEERLAWLADYRGAAISLGVSSLSQPRSGDPSHVDTSVDFKAGVLLARITAARLLGDKEKLEIAQGQLRQALRPTTLDGSLAEETEALESTLRKGLSEEVLEWGLWTETGRIAAVFGATEELDRHWRRRPKSSPRDVRALNPSVEASLGRIETLLADGAQNDEFSLLADQFGQLNSDLSAPLLPAP
ncbi:MAG: hypothetical protein AAF481_07605 [Acidobacteriota bacterium]